MHLKNGHKLHLVQPPAFSCSWTINEASSWPLGMPKGPLPLCQDTTGAIRQPACGKGGALGAKEGKCMEGLHGGGGAHRRAPGHSHTLIPGACDRVRVHGKGARRLLMESGC